MEERHVREGAGFVVVCEVGNDKASRKKESAPQNATKLRFAGRFTRSRERKQGLGVFFGVTVLACAEDEELFV